MLVLDASVVIELLVSDDDKKMQKLESRIRNEVLVAPDHMWMEVVSVVTRMCRIGMLSEIDALRVLRELQRLNISSVRTNSFVDRVWKLRKNVYSRDAAYVAIAEALQSPLLTCDRKLSRATGPQCVFELW